jgi:AmpE protein
MSLISLLIALASQKLLSSSLWQFSTFYSRYLKTLANIAIFKTPFKKLSTAIVAILIPVVIVHLFLNWIDDSLLYLVVSSLILIICFGCIKTRELYKNYLLAAFRGEMTTCDMHQKQLQQDKNLPPMGFGQMLIWLNYRYFIAIMFFFITFGAAGALFYRLLVTLSEKSGTEDEDFSDSVKELVAKALFIIDWLPVRLVAFGYMLVGHFSKAMPAWLENIFELDKPAYKVLSDVAQKSEDFMIDEEDCTAEPCLLVRLAKRTSLLCLALVALLILSGVIS